MRVRQPPPPQEEPPPHEEPPPQEDPPPQEECPPPHEWWPPPWWLPELPPPSAHQLLPEPPAEPYPERRRRFAAPFPLLERTATNSITKKTRATAPMRKPIPPPAFYPCIPPKRDRATDACDGDAPRPTAPKHS
ncbi:hypothetical protein GCM10012280_17690 [Wenjunlia tyrosinilytica]|uniref:Uncharacterized protein n=1 Tax=Wenjunlia tyrosinilytica TaxID=1544741 RepID=A0A917ZM81_9ACTN|nr:hypothetical protein GCM10012280_17690 [Wenjunlia tyrosinilytica]